MEIAAMTALAIVALGFAALFIRPEPRHIPVRVRRTDRRG